MKDMTSIKNNTRVKVPNITFPITKTISKVKYDGPTPNPQGKVDLEQRNYLDCHLMKNQNGFRSGRTTTSQILVLRQLIEGVKDKNLEAILIFIDFKKAFDTIHRGKMIAILKAYRIPEELVTAISIMYDYTTAKVITPDGETETFNILAGVLQGDTLAPYLFVIVIDYVTRTALQ